MIQYDNNGISLDLSETAKHKCRAPPKSKQGLNIVIHGRKDPVMMHPTLATHNAYIMTAVLPQFLALVLECGDTT